VICGPALEFDRSAFGKLGGICGHFLALAADGNPGVRSVKAVSTLGTPDVLAEGTNKCWSPAQPQQDEKTNKGD